MEYGGPDGELSASLRYLSQRFTMPDNKGKALLTDIGTEELAHLEIVGSIVGQLTDGEGARSFDKYGKGDYYVDHGNGVYAANAMGVPFTAAYFQVKADPIADLVENLAADDTTYLAQSFRVSELPINLYIILLAVFRLGIDNYSFYKHFYHFISQFITMNIPFDDFTLAFNI